MVKIKLLSQVKSYFQEKIGFLVKVLKPLKNFKKLSVFIVIATIVG